jgi:hypothetical protein
VLRDCPYYSGRYVRRENKYMNLNWEAIGAIGEVLGALGVVLTLIYFGVQLKRQSQQLKIQNFRGQASEAQQAAIFQASPHMLEVLEKCYSQNSTELDFKEKLLIESYIQVHLARCGADFKLYKEGIVSEEQLSTALMNMALILSSNWPSLWWSVIKPIQDPLLVELIDKKLETPDMSDYSDFFGINISAKGT